MRNDISIFEFLKDARDVPHFLKGLSKTNLLAMNTAFVCVVDNCKEYSQAKNSKIMKIAKEAVAEGTNVWNLRDPELSEAVNVMQFFDTRNKNAMKYILDSAFANPKTRDIERLKKRLNNLIKDVDAQDWILPHLKLALAYSPHTNSTI